MVYKEKAAKITTDSIFKIHRIIVFICCYPDPLGH
jgi:hypothetical protein